VPGLAIKLAIGPTDFVLLAGVLFAIGLFGALTRKNAIAVLMCIELMLNAVNINLIAFSRFITPLEFTGQIFAIFVITVAAAEVGVGLAIMINIFRHRLSVDLDDFDWLKW